MTMQKLTRTAVVAGAVVVAATAGAQGRGRNAAGVPPGQLPPAGMCRIWIDGVPPGHQPAPTDCATARAHVPANGRVVYGDAQPGDVDHSRRHRTDRGNDDRADGRRAARGDEEDEDEHADDAHERHHRRVVQRGQGRICRDPDHDGRCDDDHRNPNACVRDARGRCDPDICVDPTNDGRCDRVYIPSRYPTTLPEMIGAVLVAQGKGSPEVVRWLGDRPLTARSTTATDGKVERITWLDARGRVVQVWIDRDHDGRADVVQLYRNGRLVRTIGP